MTDTASDLGEAFYLPLGEGRYAPTKATESPWDTTAQHGGPPSALLASLATAQAAPGQRAARVSVDFLGPIPRRELTVEVAPVRPGRLVSLTEARMSVDGRAVAVARVWHLATGPTPPVVSPQTAPPPLPAEGSALAFLPHLDGWGYGRAVEWRWTGGAPDRSGPADVWTRLLLPLVAGEPLTPLARLLVVADAANGLSAELPLTDWLSIPPGMTTHVLREPVGEWVHLSCRSTLAADGLGLCSGVLSDADGAVGEVAQPLLVRSR